MEHQNLKTAGKKKRQRGEDTRNALIEAAEQLMLDEGYAAVTARRLMTKANLKSQLLHYHFSSIDDLFLAVIRRRYDVNVRKMVQALSGSDPMTNLWEYLGDQLNSRISIEFLALACHRPKMRMEVQRYAEQLRLMQTEAITRFFEERGVEPDTPPIVSAMVLTGLWQNLHLEAVHGISLGHEELKTFITRTLRELIDSLPESGKPDKSRRNDKPRTTSTARKSSKTVSRKAKSTSSKRGTTRRKPSSTAKSG